METTSKRHMSYKQFATTFNIKSLQPDVIKQIAHDNNIKIDDLYNVIDDAKRDGRL